jgi:hypothetical protein
VFKRKFMLKGGADNFFFETRLKVEIKKNYTLSRMLFVNLVVRIEFFWAILIFGSIDWVNWILWSLRACLWDILLCLLWELKSIASSGCLIFHWVGHLFNEVQGEQFQWPFVWSMFLLPFALGSQWLVLGGHLKWQFGQRFPFFLVETQ